MTSRMHVFLLTTLAIAGAGLFQGADRAAAQAVRPLTLEGKRALYQRVIAIPGAGLAESAGAAARDAIHGVLRVCA
jgi:hypothetical protein